MPPLTEEQLQELLNQRFGQPQGIARLNPLAFQFEDAFTPYSSAQMDALRTMRLPGTVFEPDSADPAFFSDFTRGYDYDPYRGTKEDFNYLYGTRPAFEYDTEFVEPNIKSGIKNVTPLENDLIAIEQGFAKNTPSDQGTNFKFLPSANEDETDVVEEKKRGGIADLFRALLGFAIPGVSLFFNKGRDALGGIRSLNQRLRNTDFGQSRTGAEYMMRRRERKQAERAQKAMPDVYRSAKEQGFTNDGGGFSTSRADRAGTSLGSGQFSSKRSTGRQGY